MITYMTRTSIMRTSYDLDTINLAQQIKDAQAILDQLTGIAEETNHPALKMWEGYEFALCIYGMAMCMEWHTQRGYAATHDLSFFNFERACKELRSEAQQYGESWTYVPPPWFEDIDVLRSHRSNLIRRWPKRYKKVWKRTPDDMPYIWPIVDDDGGYVLKLSKEDKAHLKSKERSLPKSVLERIANA